MIQRLYAAAHVRNLPRTEFEQLRIDRDGHLASIRDADLVQMAHMLRTTPEALRCRRREARGRLFAAARGPRLVAT
jgi:hypothetical protein